MKKIIRYCSAIVLAGAIGAAAYAQVVIAGPEYCASSTSNCFFIEYNEDGTIDDWLYVPRSSMHNG